MDTNYASTVDRYTGPALANLVGRFSAVRQVHSLAVIRSTGNRELTYEIRVTISGAPLSVIGIYRGAGHMWFAWSFGRWVLVRGDMADTLAEIVAMWEFGEPR